MWRCCNRSVCLCAATPQAYPTQARQDHSRAHVTRRQEHGQETSRSPRARTRTHIQVHGTQLEWAHETRRPEETRPGLSMLHMGDGSYGLRLVSLYGHLDSQRSSLTHRTALKGQRSIRYNSWNPVYLSAGGARPQVALDPLDLLEMRFEILVNKSER